MMLAEVSIMSENYAILTDAHKIMVDSYIDFLADKQDRFEKNILDAIEEYESGKAIGPFSTIESLMAALNA